MTHSTLRLRSRGYNPPNRQVVATVRNLYFWIEQLAILILAIPISLPGLLLPIDWHPYIVTTLFIFLWVHLWFYRDRGKQAALSGKATYLVLLWLPITVVITTNFASSWQAVGSLLLGITLYHVVTNHWWLERNPGYLWWLLLGMGTLLAGIAPSIVNWKSEFRLFYLPLYDLFALISLNSIETLHANLLAGALVLFIPLIISYLLPAKSAIYKITLVNPIDGAKALRFHQPRKAWQRALPFLITVGLILMMGILLLTQSRGGYLGMVLATMIIFLLRWPRLGMLVPILLVGLGYGIYNLGGDAIFDLLGADNTFGGAEWRGPVLSASWQAFQDFTWTGIGIGNFQQVMPLLYPNPAIANTAATHAHNLLLQIGLDLGLPGLAAYITFYITMIGMAIAVLRRTRTPQATAAALGARWDGKAIIAPPEVGVTLSTKRFMRQLVHLERTRQQHWALAAGCLAALVGMQVHGLLDAVTWGNKLAFIPWLIFAQITLLYRYQTHDQL